MENEIVRRFVRGEVLNEKVRIGDFFWGGGMDER
jgi:hypothetical protein